MNFENFKVIFLKNKKFCKMFYFLKFFFENGFLGKKNVDIPEMIHLLKRLKI